MPRLGLEGLDLELKKLKTSSSPSLKLKKPESRVDDKIRHYIEGASRLETLKVSTC